MPNPFFFREISSEEPFCDRERELKQLCDHARARANVVMYSPRRYGKTSLANRVQGILQAEGAVTFYVQFYGVASIDDIAARLAKSIFAVTRRHDSLFRKAIQFIKAFRPILTIEPDEQKVASLGVQLATTHLRGYDLLENVMESLDLFIKKVNIPVHITFDEFQEITTLNESQRLEGMLRDHIQKQRAAYLFIGSRRSLLLSMFNERRRAFFASAINYPLEPLPYKDFVSFIIDGFKRGGKQCENKAAQRLVELVEGYPYYGQKLAYCIYDLVAKKATQVHVDEGFKLLLREEKPIYESILMGLSPSQIALLRALALDPSSSVFAQEYMQRNHLNSIGGVQTSLKKLLILDLIEQGKNKQWKLVDPLFAHWLRQE